MSLLLLALLACGAPAPEPPKKTTTYTPGGAGDACAIDVEALPSCKQVRHAITGAYAHVRGTDDAWKRCFADASWAAGERCPSEDMVIKLRDGAVRAGWDRLGDEAEEVPSEPVEEAP